MRLSRIGGPTVLAEFDGWRVLVDPTFDAPGRRYSFGWGTSSRTTLGPALGPALRPVEVGPVDLVLVSHDHHADNLDDARRQRSRSTPRPCTLARRRAARHRLAPQRDVLGPRA
ncbi:MBL fold metallo-hydrolase [Agromyces aurantiacus]|uniref:MBL fold metallo-hydrolase n=1 Tax=Agromyces aurantiacus TaxID=165814 RepID=A0ABV9R6W8_9MICO|nr:MBL fold metallo-hydrolase [Agromyces aurantiacus]MBM7503733.1 L-ascorbate metabolism protein UlaG (beta-lactamase superfamily) [Agromyces aurantiacus]